MQFAENLPGYDQCGGDVAWMSADKTEFDVAPGHAVLVRITADSAAVSQPGSYDGQVTISTDSPYGRVAPVGVTMQATPPRTWGAVAGTVSDAAGAPIAGATVAICTMYGTRTGACGPTKYTLKTDTGGGYRLWLDKGFNPLQIIAAKDGYSPAMKVARIQRGEATTVDFALDQAGAFTSAKLQGYLNTHMHSAPMK